jgi:hypothetical protein
MKTIQQSHPKWYEQLMTYCNEAIFCVRGKIIRICWKIIVVVAQCLTPKFFHDFKLKIASKHPFPNQAIHFIFLNPIVGSFYWLIEECLLKILQKGTSLIARSYSKMYKMRLGKVSI